VEVHIQLLLALVVLDMRVARERQVLMVLIQYLQQLHLPEAAAAAAAHLVLLPLAKMVVPEAVLEGLALVQA